MENSPTETNSPAVTPLPSNPPVAENAPLPPVPLAAEVVPPAPVVTAPVVEAPASGPASTPAVTTPAPIVPVASPTDAPHAEIKPPTKHEKFWITVLHLSVIVGVGLIVPLLLYFLRKHGSTVHAHAKEAGNFHLSILIYALIIGLIAFFVIGLPILVVTVGVFIVGWLWATVCSIVAAIHGTKGKPFRYPLTLRLIK